MDDAVKPTDLRWLLLGEVISSFYLPLNSLLHAAKTTQASFAEQIRLLEELRIIQLHEAEAINYNSIKATLGLDAPEDDVDAYAEAYVSDGLSTAEDASNEARKAFAIAAYHLWEHAVRSATEARVDSVRISKNKQGPRGADLECCARKLGWKVSPDISSIRTLVNLLKHDSKGRWEDLEKQWPALWQSAQNYRITRDLGYANAIRISQEQLLEIFNAVRQSGPPATRIATDEEVARLDERLRS